jgi:methylated-DNA-protein-cysteine methyltransferase-like protein
VPEPQDFAQLVLQAVESIPRGRVMTYGDVAEYAGIRSPRSVGRVLAGDGGTVPWHRVLRSDGSLAEHLYTEQRQRLLEEGVRFSGAGGNRVDLANYRWDGESTSAE